MPEQSSSQFDSFLFWRLPIPRLHLTELQDLGLPAGEPPAAAAHGREDEVELSQFSSFHFWRAPISSVDALLEDLNLLL